MRLLQVIVRHNATRYAVFTNTSESVFKLCQRIGGEERCNLLFMMNGKSLDQTARVFEAGIKNGSTIEVFAAGPGGFPVIDPAKIAQGVANMVLKIAQFLQRTIFDKIKYAWNKAQQIREYVWKKVKYSRTFAFMLKTYAMFIKFYPVIYLVLIILAFFGKPFEYIMLVLALVIVGVLYVIYAILTLPPFIYVMMLIWFVVMDIIPLLAYCCIFGALLVFVLVFCLILAVLNAILGNSLKNLVFCQNSPASWYQTPNYHLGNKYDRGLFCNRPCFPGYYPDPTGMSCLKTSKNQPSYCPQAEVFRMYTGQTNDRLYDYKKYNDKNLAYLSKSPAQREGILKQYYLNKIRHLNTCGKKMKDYDYLTLAICSASKDPKLQDVCRQAYCMAPNNYPFCSAITNYKDTDKLDVYRNLIKILIFTIVLAISIIIVLKTIR
jgi:hypothetical protein